MKEGIQDNEELHPIWVITKDDKIMSSENVYFASEYFPEQNWEKQNLISVEILSDKYIDTPGEEIEWKNFFRRVGVQETASSETIERFAEVYVKNKSKEEFQEELKRHGGPEYDLVAESNNIYIEVKGRSKTDVEDIELEPFESKAAINYGENYYLAAVFGIPNNPKLYLLKNPIKYSEKQRVTISKDAIKQQSRIIG